jgi:hypothetical protein
MSGRSLKQRVTEAAADALARQKSVSPIDVAAGIGWLQSSHLNAWQRGQVEALDHYLGSIRPENLADLAGYLNEWAQAKGLTQTETEYLSSTRQQRPLRVFKSDIPELELAWRTRWDAPDITPKKKEKLAAPPDLVVVQPVRDWECAECGGTGGLLIMDDAGPLCLSCADMDHLEFLPSGDAALTRRAKKASRLSAVVVRWSKTRKRYERQGILVEEAAIEQAEQQCLADADVRERRRERDRLRRADEDVEFTRKFAAQIARLFPGCLADRAEGIARHTSLRGSGRVGRSAAGRELGDQAVTLAVVASIRHEDTDYDELLMSGTPRAAARDEIRDKIDEVLDSFRQ